MKQIAIFILIGVICPFISQGQETLKFNFDSTSKEIKGIDRKKRNLIFDNSYVIEVEGVNSAHMKLVSNPKPYTLESNIPDQLKVFFPGISTSRYFPDPSPLVKEDFKGDRLLSFFQATAMDSAFKYLSTIDSLAKKLYKDTKYTPNLEIATIMLNGLMESEEAPNLMTLVQDKINFILFRREILLKHIEHQLALGSFDDELLIELALRFNSYHEAINKNRYLASAIFIENSTTAKTSVKTSTFTAQKSGTDIGLIIIDTYKNDTIYKGEFDFYHYKKWSFDFSTGFIVNDIIDIPYYIETLPGGQRFLREEEFHPIDVSVGGFLNVSYKYRPWLMVGPQFGVGISLLDHKPRYAFGLGALLGRKGKIGIHGGVTFGKSKEVSSIVASTAEGLSIPDNVTNVPLYDKLNSGKYISLTYNLTKKVK